MVDPGLLRVRPRCQTASMSSPTADPAEPLSLTRRDWAALLTIGFGVSLVIMAATIVNVALPVVIEDLSLTATEAWSSRRCSSPWAGSVTCGVGGGCSSSACSCS